jgi:hypothetical protein
LQTIIKSSFDLGLRRGLIHSETLANMRGQLQTLLYWKFVHDALEFSNAHSSSILGLSLFLRKNTVYSGLAAARSIAPSSLALTPYSLNLLRSVRMLMPNSFAA